MKRFTLFSIGSLLLGAVMIFFLMSDHQSRSYQIMGTELKITVKDRSALSHIQAAANRMREIEKLLSRYLADSEVSRLNRGEKFDLSSDTQQCLDLAKKAKQLTSGAFDVYYNGELNLDGIGKGYAVEEARRVLYKRGVKNAIIDMRSSIAVLGGPWRIGIKHPRQKDQILGIIVLSDQEALSTSGDYEQGRHIIDPKTKRPAVNCQAVTVVTRDAGPAPYGGGAGLADALSTGIFVLGPERGIALAKQLDLKVIIVAADGKIYKHNL